MSKRPRTQDELEAQLDRQRRFLVTSVAAFDSGDKEEAVRLATTIRVLVHDTKSSHSLLHQLNRKTDMFFDTSLKQPDGNLAPFGGLVVVAMGTTSRYIAPLDDSMESKFVDFESWWNSPVFQHNAAEPVSRRELILAASNQDGGAHVDPAIDETYDRLTTGEYMGLRKSDGEHLIGPQQAAIRQIAHELLRTLDPDYRKKPDMQDVEMMVAGFSFSRTVEPRPTPLARGTKEPGRNAPCPCGSGKKYKHCHLGSFGRLG